MTMLLPGKYAFVFNMSVDGDVYRAVNPPDLSGALNQKLSYFPLIVGSGPVGCNNSLVIGFENKLHIAGVYQITTLVWFDLHESIDIRMIEKCFIDAWNQTVGHRSSTFLFPGTEDIQLVENLNYNSAYEVFESGSQFSAASAREAGGITGFFSGVVSIFAPIQKIYQCQFEYTKFTSPIPVWGVTNLVDRSTMSNILISNDPRLIGKEINELTVARLIRETVTEVAHQVDGLADPASRAVQEQLNNLTRFVSENNPIPFSMNEIQTFKSVAIGGLIIFGGFLLIKGVNKGTGA